MRALVAQGYSVEELCEAFGVSRSGFYRHLHREQTPRRREDEQLRPVVVQAFAESRHTYGTPRLRHALKAQGLRISRERVGRLMREEGLRALQKRRFVPRTTTSDPRAAAAPNLLLNAAAPTAPDEVWVSDITYLPTRGGWLYLAVLMDAFSRRVLGWATSSSLNRGLVVEAFHRACATRGTRPRRGLILHSDRGCQYTSASFQRLVRLLGARPSMSRTGNCYDNAAMESFWASLKTEAFRQPPDTRAQARALVHDYIDGFYNTRRLHSSLKYQTPLAFEQQHNLN